MRNSLMSVSDKIMLRKRALIESVKEVTSETFITNLMSQLMFRRTTQTGNLLYGKISPDSNDITTLYLNCVYPL